MNEPAIKKHFAKALKSDRVFIGGLQDGKIVISDVACLLILEPDSPVFKNRKTWPELPSVEENLYYFQGVKQEKAPNVIGSVATFAKDANVKLTYSGWSHTNYDGINGLMFLTKNGNPVFISAIYINLIGGVKYNFYGSGWDKPVIVKEDEETIAILMPIKLPDKKFPDLVKWE